MENTKPKKRSEKTATRKNGEIIAKELYWTPLRALTYNKLWNFIIGGTGIGKTYGMKFYCMNKFKKSRQQFLWMRRRDADLDDIQGWLNEPSIWDDLGEEPDKWKLDNKGHILHKREKDANGKFVKHPCEIDGKPEPDDEKLIERFGEWEVAGYYKSLKTLLKKGVAYPNVWTIVFEEFQPHDENQRYYKDEVGKFMGAWDAIHRYKRRVKVFFLSNKVSMYNPYMLALGYEPNGKEFWVGNAEIGPAHSALIQMCDSAEIASKFKETEMGRMIMGTTYGNYALENMSQTENNTFVEKKPGTAEPLMNIVVDNHPYGIWADEKTALFYCTKADCKTLPYYAQSDDDHTPEIACLRLIIGNPIWRSITDAYDSGMMRFDSQKTKSAMLKVLKRGV